MMYGTGTQYVIIYSGTRYRIKTRIPQIPLSLLCDPKRKYWTTFHEFETEVYHIFYSFLEEAFILITSNTSATVNVYWLFITRPELSERPEKN
jgi:hypothetical protein